MLRDVTTTSPTTSEAAARPRRRRVIAAAVAGGALVIGGALFAWQRTRGGDGGAGAMDAGGGAAVAAKADAADADAALKRAQAELAAGTFGEAEASARRAIELYTSAVGADGEGTGRAWRVLGEAQQGQGAWSDAYTALRTAVKVLEPRGETPELAATLMSLALAEQGTGHHDDAVISIERAVDILRAGGPDRRHDLAMALVAEARALGSLGHADDARERHDEAQALFDALDDKDVNRGLSLVDRGDLARTAGNCAAAIPDYEQAVAFFTRTLGDKDPYNLYALAPLAHCQLELGKHGKALELLERARTLPTGGGMEEVLAVQVRFDRGRALVESKKDVAGGLAAARAARQEMDTVPGAINLAPAADAWLAKR